MKPAFLNSYVREAPTCANCNQAISTCDNHKTGDTHYFKNHEDIECNDGTHLCAQCSEQLQNEE